MRTDIHAEASLSWGGLALHKRPTESQAPSLAMRGAPVSDRAPSSPPWSRLGFGECLLPGRLLQKVLDEIDYGLRLATRQAEVGYPNGAAPAECGKDEGALRLAAGTLVVRQPQQREMLAQALRGAAQGRRTLLSLAQPEAAAVFLAVIPLGGHELGEPGWSLLVLGKRQVCETLSVEFFARAHGLTPAEAKVLQTLCQEMEPALIAEQLGVAISTVRTQISSIRSKTGAASIRDLVKRVAVLPPIVPALGRAVP